MKETKIVRAPQDDWHLVLRYQECSPRCPSDGHRVRVEEPGLIIAEVYAESRVRALHSIWAIRAASTGLMSQAAVAELLTSLSAFGADYDFREMDTETFFQIVRLRGTLAALIARKFYITIRAAMAMGFAKGYSEGFGG